MKKRIFLIVFLIIFATIGVFAYTQVDNIMGIIYSFKYSNNEIESLLDKNNETLKNELEEILGYPIRDFTEEEKKQIEEGTVTKKEVIEKIIYDELEKNITSDKKNNSGFGNSGKNESDTWQTKRDSNQPATKSNNGKSKNTSGQTQASESVSSDISSNYYIMELYSLKSEYIGILDGMVSSAISDYKKLNKKEQTRSKQLEIGASYASRATALEKQCDGEVESILNKLENELIREGKSTSIISTIRSSYATEKSLKRAYYLNMFK